MKIIFNCLMAWLAGWGLGLLLGFFDYGGGIFYDLRGGLNAGALCAVVFAISTLWGQLFQRER